MYYFIRFKNGHFQEQQLFEIRMAEQADRKLGFLIIKM